MFALARALLRKLRKGRFSYTPLVEVRVSRGALLHNLRAFWSIKSGLAIAPVLKSNAYGHGLIEVANIVDDANVPFLCVDSYFEALVPRNEGIRSPILIIGYTPLDTILKNQLKNIAFAIISSDELYRLAKNARVPVTIHLKIDTGMHRHGVKESGVNEALGLIKANPRIKLQGIYTHLADADTPESAHASKQIGVWNEIVQRFRESFANLAYYHCAASAGGHLSNNIDANVLRLGIGLYGMNVSPSPLQLQPALEMITRITSTRTLKKGEAVGYNATFTAPRDMAIASIPVGYYEGVDRRLSNKGAVMIRNTPCPIVGRVSMNITSVDVSHLPDVKLDEPVVVISRRASDPNSVENIARACETIPYEILVHIPAHLRRVVV